MVAPPGTARWSLQDVVLEAPQGTLFVSALVRDFDGDGAKDAFALVRPPDPSALASLAYYRGRSPGARLQATSTFAPSALSVPSPPGAACTDDARLLGIGRRSVLAEIGVLCSAASGSGPDRWIAVVEAGTEAAVRLALTASDPPGAATLSLDASASDRDGDGRDDVTLVVSLEGGGPPFEPGPRVSGTFAWLDRPAGLSPDVRTAQGSFAALASQASARAARAKDAEDVPPFVAQARSLWRAACVDSGAARLVGVVGTAGVSCSASRPLDDLALAEARAFATMGDGLRAAVLLGLAERSAGAFTPARAAEAEKWLSPVAPPASARSVRAIGAVPSVTTGHEPAWGALAFEPSGKLLVRTRAGVVRVDPEAGDEAAADGVAWQTAVTSPDGSMRWIEAYDPCDGFALRATFASGDDMRDLALPVAPPPGVRCAGARGAPATTVPLAWTGVGLEALVDGVPLLVAADIGKASPMASFVDAPAPPGSALSPDGKTVVLPTHVGLVERSVSRTRLLRGAVLDGTYDEQRDCTVSNDGVHVACVRAGRAWVGAWD
jgi:hypothetical protein